MKAMDGQDEIGWMALCQGFYHTGWSTAQQRHYLSIGLNQKMVNIRRWKKMLSVIMSDYCLKCWSGRNESIHGKDIESSREKSWNQ